MKPILKTLTFALILFSCVKGSAQPGDLTHPTQKLKARTRVFPSLYAIPANLSPVIFYDGINISYDRSFLNSLNIDKINSVKTSKDSVFNHEGRLKFNSVIEITTIDGVNPGLKLLKDKTNFWIKDHPLAVFYLNGQLPANDLEKLTWLTNIKPEHIKEIKTLDANQGKQALGQAGENGVVLITTK